MPLPLQDFATMVRTQATAMTASCQQLVDMTVGSVVRALLEANASIGLWIQWLIVQVLAATRASTSIGADLDSWVADFGMSRLQAVAAAGTVTLSRSTIGLATTVSPGVLVRTGLGSGDQTFTVIGDATNPAWNGQAYTVKSADSSVVVRVVAQQPGTSGNVVAGSVTMLATAILGIDAVTNQYAMSGGLDAESDNALRARFAGFLDSRSRGTSQAVGFAITSLQRGITYTIADRIDAAGATRPGHFTVTVDDGTGAPNSKFLADVADAIDDVRPIGATFSVRPPLVVAVSVQLRVDGPASIIGQVQQAIRDYLVTLPIGAGLTITRLYQIAYGVDPSVRNASGALINGVDADLTVPVFGLLRPSTVTVVT